MLIFRHLYAGVILKNSSTQLARKFSDDYSSGQTKFSLLHPEDGGPLKLVLELNWSMGILYKMSNGFGYTMGK